MKEYDMDTELKQFTDTIDMALNLTQKKRFYISDYGYGNVREVINGEQDKLVRGQNWDKFHLEMSIKSKKRQRLCKKAYDLNTLCSIVEHLEELDDMVGLEEVKKTYFNVCNA